ncbi:MAG: hypothetical protein COV84_03530 [Candidatus Portnoybacteria bacterium CG11_big_fil_rev_8_21_14_0_20_40_15]|uniref:Uncharacterized protein n=1 Tax=Candidatus Portnoybacteria bacterium CG11_big_fil_rev_8_21_14_0_20_40_15 TaxID=1974817 RepID=A0A2H0KSB1_9BACT|nr:MAG: hypothetical protein COV84_03530 [Candidatus Portnoybacteria bacterium CG11_big_fil_rev_8_21_14_0_20_40_15]
MLYSENSSNPSSKAKLTTGHSAFRRRRRRKQASVICDSPRSLTISSFPLAANKEIISPFQENQ